MKSNILSAISAIIGIFASGLFAQTGAKPPVPFIDKGACPFECCTYRQWDVKTPTIIRSAMKDNAPVSFRLNKGEKVLGMTGVVITTQPGEVKVLKKTKLGKLDVKTGETLILLTNLGEGFHKVWYHGRIYQVDTIDETKFKTIREPKAVWWVKIKNRR